MRHHSTVFASIAALVALQGTANAQTAPDPVIEVDLSMAVVSDYRFRGISLTDFEPAVQPDLTVRPMRDELDSSRIGLSSAVPSPGKGEARAKSAKSGLFFQ